MVQFYCFHPGTHYFPTKPYTEAHDKRKYLTKVNIDITKQLICICWMFQIKYDFLIFWNNSFYEFQWSSDFLLPRFLIFPFPDGFLIIIKLALFLQALNKVNLGKHLCSRAADPACHHQGYLYVIMESNLAIHCLTANSKFFVFLAWTKTLSF